MNSPAYLHDIRRLILLARQKAYSAVNIAMVEAYWQIGKQIVEEEQQGEKRAGYSEGMMKELSKALSAEFGKGFSVANLENFRKFYLTFPEYQISYALRRELTWTHYRLIMRVENLKAREYYINECANPKIICLRRICFYFVPLIPQKSCGCKKRKSSGISFR